jgi:hypothetical protein
MSTGWVMRWRIQIIVAILVALYAAALSAFLTYQSRTEAAHRLRQETIAKCLDSGGHIGRGDTCWHPSPDENKQLLP